MLLLKKYLRCILFDWFGYAILLCSLTVNVLKLCYHKIQHISCLPQEFSEGNICTYLQEFSKFK